MMIIVNAYSVLAGLLLRDGGLGISSGYYECGPRLLSYENRRKIESKETPSRLMPAYLWYLTGHLKIILATTLELLGNLKPIAIYFTWGFLMNEIKVRI